ncbi:GerMN domain-containing protein [bacterium]|nr:GerMN domain-containing protein [bacterium]
MNRNQKLLLIIIGFCMLVVLGIIAFNVFMPKPEIKPNDIEVSQRSVEEEPAQPEQEQTEEVKVKEFVNIFFIGKNDHNEEVYKAVKREYNKEVDGSKIRFAVYSLINGPKQAEKERGVYTEIPPYSQVINITEQSNKIIINLNSSFVNGGGADSLYKRLYQLIKTVKQNTSIPVYLYIDGQKADVVGGEGLMITQLLSNSSLEN